MPPEGLAVAVVGLDDQTDVHVAWTGDWLFLARWFGARRSELEEVRSAVSDALRNSSPGVGKSGESFREDLAALLSAMAKPSVSCLLLQRQQSGFGGWAIGTPQVWEPRGDGLLQRSFPGTNLGDQTRDYDHKLAGLATSAIMSGDAGAPVVFSTNSTRVVFTFGPRAEQFHGLRSSPFTGSTESVLGLLVGAARCAWPFSKTVVGCWDR